MQTNTTGMGPHQNLSNVINPGVLENRPRLPQRTQPGMRKVAQVQIFWQF